MVTRTRLQAAGAAIAFTFLVGLSAPGAGFAETTSHTASAASTHATAKSPSQQTTEALQATQSSFDTTVGNVVAAVAPPAPPSDQELHPVAVTATQTTFTPDHDQLANAKAIVDAGKAMNLPPRAWEIAVATSLQESNLRNLGNLGSQNDHDSLGLFQQRPSSGWGTPAQVTDPAFAATSFYNRLVQVPGWDNMALTWAAQKVQVSAYPDNYAKHEAEAGDIIDALYGAGPYAALAGDLH
jgi:hypothetical protein